MKRIAVIFSFILFILISVTIFFIYKKNNQPIREEKIVFNPQTQRWEKTSLRDDIDREKVLNNRSNDDGLYNQSIVRGYFDSYDGKNNSLKIKSTVRFTQNNLFELIEAKVNPAQTIYCVPEKYIDPNNGKAFDVRNLTIPVKDNQILYLPTEEVFGFENFISQAKDSTYLIVQLTQNFDKEKINYVQKMIVVGLCE